jgi:squalene-hopene/tetraprenyl-beta-curcumene cyclase
MLARWVSRVVIAAFWVLVVVSRSARGDGPQQPAQTAIERGLAFLVKDAVTWRKERNCVTCHHGTMTIWALSEAKSQGYPVTAEILSDMVQWTKDRFAPRASGPPASQPGVASVPQIYLGTMSQNLPILSRDEINRVAMHLAARQQEDGAWELPPPPNGPPPTWESRETMALWALLAWEPYVPADTQEAAAARASREKTVAWLTKITPSDTVQSLTLRLLLDARRGAPAEQVQLAIDRILKRQDADGGWHQADDLHSDAYATGQALYALSFAGVIGDRPEIQRAVSFLAATQRDDGSWPMESRGHPGVKPYANQVPITYFGSAWAVLGLVRYVPPPGTTAK